MGAYGPVPIAPKKVVDQVAGYMTQVVQEMKKQGIVYKGFLYAGVMMTEQGPKILEFNCRFGDPEAQPSVMMLKDGLYQPISAALEGKLTEKDFEFKEGAAVCVVMASNGYPDSEVAKQVKGLPIGGLENVSRWGGYKVFHAGTAQKDGKTLISGGRVLGVTYYSDMDVEDARGQVYEAVNLIDAATRALNNRIAFIYRDDIALKGVQDRPFGIL
jgi:phosphoribosylamine--glycine ligase